MGSMGTHLNMIALGMDILAFGNKAVPTPEVESSEGNPKGGRRPGTGRRPRVVCLRRLDARVHQRSQGVVSGWVPVDGQKQSIRGGTMPKWVHPRARRMTNRPRAWDAHSRGYTTQCCTHRYYTGYNRPEVSTGTSNQLISMDGEGWTWMYWKWKLLQRKGLRERGGRPKTELEQRGVREQY